MRKEIKYSLCEHDAFPHVELSSLVRKFYFSCTKHDNDRVNLSHPVLHFALNFGSVGFTHYELIVVKKYIIQSKIAKTYEHTIRLLELLVDLESLMSGATVKCGS